MNPQKYFSPALAHTSEKAARQELLIITFILISMVFAVAYFIMSFFNGFLMARYVMSVSTVLFLIQLYAYKFRWQSLRAITHGFVIICYGVVLILALASNGLNSFVLPWISLIPLMALVLISSRAAWVWCGIGFCSVLMFVVIEPTDIIPPHLFMPGNTLLTASLHIGLLFIILILSYIFDQQKAFLVNTIETQNQELIDSRQIIEAQHQILLEKNEGLEQEIQSRTKELVEYNQQLEQFAFISSHNLRAPIARIMGLGNLMQLTSSKEDEIMIQKELVQSARELDRVVKDLSAILDVRNSSDKVVSQLDIAQEFELLLANLQKDIAETGTQITLALEQVPVLTTVKPYFDSIFINLITNAIKYRKPTEPQQIDIRATWVDGFACFTVRDRGLGIDLNASRKKLFTLYSRFHEHIEGKGLGLYMVKTQLDAMGGRIEAESEPGVGTTFTVYLKPARSEA
jgi:signal transduction histidine kinase